MDSNDDPTEFNEKESLERALADIEMLSAAYPDETSTEASASFPLHISLRLSDTAHVVLELDQGYPVNAPVRVVSHRCVAAEKTMIEAAVVAIRSTAMECQQDGMEGSLACCAAALEVWQDMLDKEGNLLESGGSVSVENTPGASLMDQKSFEWIAGEPLLDRKSTFQARVCRITSEADVHLALFQLLDGNSKLQRATHNMVRSKKPTWPLTEDETLEMAHFSSD